MIYSNRQSKLIAITQEELGRFGTMKVIYASDEYFYNKNYLKSFIDSPGNVHVESYDGRYDLIDGVFTE